MSNFNIFDAKDIRNEEKRLYEEYKRKLQELKKVQKEKEAVGQVFAKGLLPIYVLYILSITPINGNEISTQIGIRTNGKWIPSTGGIYPLLKKLENDELIIGKWDNPEKKFQKIYHLTSKGKIEYEKKKELLKPKIEKSLEVFKIIYNDIY